MSAPHSRLQPSGEFGGQSGSAIQSAGAISGIGRSASVVRGAPPP